MTKRAYQKFERNKRDFYRTPYKAVAPLLPFLKPNTRFHEPCAGDGTLIKHLEKSGHICTCAGDITPVANDNPFADCGIQLQDALNLKKCNGEMFITNPPWTRSILEPLIQKFVELSPVTWLLFDADYMHLKRAIPMLKLCRRIVSVGRISWFGGTTGFDNCAWYQFANSNDQPTEFYGKAA
tara:strand:- start:917 stop:1462 length:546 start_codon:yes stop_codon:yes gene_type:complete